MHFMERKIYDKLLTWKKSPKRMPLILHGAKQVGKTHSALTFGKKHYKNTIYINFEDNIDIATLFDKDFNIDRLIRELSVKTGETIFMEDSLIIFDEIQSCERALTSLKYFCENAPEYHIIATGSLLGVANNREKYSFPVGKVEMLTLYPLDFEEFLWALGQKNLSELIREHFNRNEDFTLHELSLEYYRKYLVVGGMPKAVLEYLDEDDFNFVLSIQKNINDAYIADMAKYATPNETTKIMAAFNTIPAQLAKDNKKFQYKVIKSGARAYDYETPIDWLKSSGVILKCIKVTEGKLPLTAYADNNSFKVYMKDTGLLCSKFGIPAKVILSESSALNNFKGALTENYIAGCLTMAGYVPFYWESKGRAEVDFIIQDEEGNIIPIEVKSSNNVRSKSLNEFIKRYQPSYAMRISTRNFGFENGIKSIPLYSAFCLST